MKKFIIIIGALLFAAVFMSGCVTETEDPIVGIWENPNPEPIPNGVSFETLTFVFNADGTGFSLAGFAGTPVFGKIDFAWENAGDGKYFITAADTKYSGIQASTEFVLAGDVLTIPTPEVSIDHHRVTLEEYVPGLWTGIRGDYNEYTDIQVLLYLGEDGKGHTAIYGPEVLNMEDVFTAEFTWDLRENNVVLTGPNSGSMELSLVNSELVFAGLYPLHKYTTEDMLYGLWQSDKPHVEDGVSYDIVQFIKSDGTGTEIWTVPGSDTASAKYTFTWKMIDSVTYEAVYDDGEVWQFEAVYSQLYDGETWYNKVGFDVLQDYALNKGA